MSTYQTYFGTYTDGESNGIYRGVLDDEQGTVEQVELAAELADPTFLATHPDGDRLYALGIGDEGPIVSFDIEPDGSLTERSRRETGWAGPCHIDVDPTGQALTVAHYHSGAVSVLPVTDDGVGEPTTIEHEGSSVDPDRQTQPHPHAARIGPDNGTVYVPDLGTDEVVVYDFDPAAATLDRRDSVSTQEGAGPRHVAFGPTDERVYVINELDSTLSAFERTPSGGLNHLDTVTTLTESVEGVNYPAEVAVHPSGEYVYGSNREHDSIAVFDVTDEGLNLRESTSTHGEWPRHFALTPSSEYIVAANEHTDNVVTLGVAEDGGLHATGDEAEIPHPVCVTILE